MTKEQAIEQNQGLVIKLARRYLNKRVEFLDLVQAGNLGLLDAFEHYSNKKSNGASFYTYAYYWVRKRIKEEVANSHLIKLPVNVQHKRNKLMQAKASYNTLLGEEPSEEILAEMLETTEEEIAKTNFRCDVDFFSDIGQVPIPEQEKQLSSDFAFEDFIKQMSDNEAFVLFSRQEGLTLAKIGTALGMCRERVRQIEEQALTKIRKRLENKAKKSLYS